MRRHILPLIIGTYFGIVLVKSQVVSWEQINLMFHFQSAYMYLVIASAVVVGAISLFILRKANVRDISGMALEIKKKPFQKGTVIGGTIFGIGWAITGACPGPIYAQFGAGTLLAAVTFLGALLGMYIYALLQTRLPHHDWGWFSRRTGKAGSSQ